VSPCSLHLLNVDILGLLSSRRVIKDEGIGGLYRGIGPKLTQSVLTAAILFMSKEKIYQVTKKVSPGLGSGSEANRCSFLVLTVTNLTVVSGYHYGCHGCACSLVNGRMRMRQGIYTVASVANTGSCKVSEVVDCAEMIRIVLLLCIHSS
jgi:hypothetical protein